LDLVFIPTQQEMELYTLMQCNNYKVHESIMEI
jgi:hypothetical protein